VRSSTFGAISACSNVEISRFATAGPVMPPQRAIAVTASTKGTAAQHMKRQAFEHRWGDQDMTGAHAG